jgi:hypothetical protein
MPRPKVRLEDRQRAVKACLPCKASKKRCDAQQPCSNCIRRRATSFCHYVDPSYAKHHRRTSQSQQADYSVGSNGTRFLTDGSETSSPLTSRKLPDESPRPVDINPAEPAADSGQNLTGGRMLMNSKGERGTRPSTFPQSPLRY